MSILFALLLAIGCAAEPVVVAEALPVSSPSSQQDNRPMNSALQTLAQSAEVIFVGKVVQRGPPPNTWSGLGVAIQTVTYQVDAVLKGDLGEGDVTVRHPVVLDSKTADANKPGLSTERFAEGASLIVLMDRQGAHWVCVSENDGVAVASDESLAEIKAAL